MTQANPGLFEREVAGMGYALAKAVDTFVATKLDGSASANDIDLSSDNTNTYLCFKAEENTNLSIPFNNLTINHASCDATMNLAVTVAGNLTITAGELDTNSGSNFALTVTGQTIVGDGSAGAGTAK